MSKIDELLDLFEEDIDKGFYQTGRETAKAKLLEALEECKPDRKYTTGLQTDITSHTQAVQNIGFNKGVREYHSNIRKLFEVER